MTSQKEAECVGGGGTFHEQVARRGTQGPARETEAVTRPHSRRGAGGCLGSRVGRSGVRAEKLRGRDGTRSGASGTPRCSSASLPRGTQPLFSLPAEPVFNTPPNYSPTPLQYSCLENPMDGGAWWAAVHGVAKSRTRLREFTFHFSLSHIGEGNGNPLQCSCLENPRDGGAWWADVFRVAQSRTRLK